MNKPYVISEDLESVREDYLLASRIEDFREDLTLDLTSMGKNVEWVNYEKLSRGIKQLINETGLPVISLDTRYVDDEDADAFIGVSRAINEDLNDAKGYDSRLGFSSIDEQFAKIGSMFVGKEVVLVDDVLFSGHNMCWIDDRLNELGIKVRSVVGGVAIGGAAERLSERGIEIQYVEFFEDVDDEICERDFAFVEGSGRKLFGKDQSSLYFDVKYGKPEQWASIPGAEVKRFFAKSLRRNLHLLRPDIPLSEIGNFLGYNGNKSVEENLTTAQERI